MFHAGFFIPPVNRSHSLHSPTPALPFAFFPLITQNHSLFVSIFWPLSWHQRHRSALVSLSLSLPLSFSHSLAPTHVASILPSVSEYSLQLLNYLSFWQLIWVQWPQAIPWSLPLPPILPTSTDPGSTCQLRGTPDRNTPLPVFLSQSASSWFTCSHLSTKIKVNPF